MTDTLPSPILLRGGSLLTLDGPAGFIIQTGDLLVEDGRIAAIGGTILPRPGDRVVEAAGHLIIPGLVNAHTHSSETFLRGRFERMPLEVWSLYAYPFLVDAPVSPRLLYLRSLLLAMESLKSGVTALSDDFFDPPGHDLERMLAAVQAYDDAGIRATISNAVINIPTLDTLPYARAVMPTDLRTTLDAAALTNTSTYLDFCAAAHAAFHGRKGRLRFMVAPSAPQRCPPDLLVACHDFAVRHDLQFHTHVLETKVQAVTGPEFHGKSLIAYMADLGILSSQTTIAHAVWVSDDDMALMGEAGVSVAHNAISNLRLGSGVAPIRRMLEAGINVALGTDGLSSNDSARVFDLMRVTALMQGVPGPDPADWLTAAEVLAMATQGGARAGRLGEVTGSLAVGKAADLVILDLDTYSFMPLNDPVKHLVFAENGNSVRLVMVAGDVVVEDGRLTRVDERTIFDEIAELMPAHLAEQAMNEQRGRVFEASFAEVHRRASQVDLGLNRYAGDLPAWRKQP
ncbi:amidohydrolase family protein [Pleomorphomonas sp. PLEO]|uniref:amidohydrolase family protein n=1 Tax=Pleomorphomonas sp. PLEO TaxID=3239306 RepID=UPI00351F3958